MEILAGIAIVLSVLFGGEAIYNKTKEPIPMKTVSRQVGDYTESVVVPMSMPADQAFDKN